MEYQLEKKLENAMDTGAMVVKRAYGFGDV